MPEEGCNKPKASIKDVYYWCQLGSLKSFLTTIYVQHQQDLSSFTTSYGWRFHKEGFFTTPTNFSSFYPSFPDLARWRHPLETIPEIVDINTTGPFCCTPAPLMTKHWLRALLDEDTGQRQSVDQEHAGGLHWRPTTLASPSGLWCLMQQEG